jgi:ubiquinone biosynthesis protein COQ4
MSGSKRIRLADARAALEKLMEDPERTDLVFEITGALAGRQPERLVRRVRAHRDGQRLLRKRPLFDPSSCDLEALCEMPPGSFGAEFGKWMSTNAFSPGLMERDFSDADDPDVAYIALRLTQTHDFWHVLSGYNRDPVGELGVLAFSVGQSPSRGIAFLLGMVVWRSVVESWRTRRIPWSPLIPYLWRAYRTGRRAAFLVPVELERLFELQLDAVRRYLEIEPLEEAFSEDALPPIAVAAPA